MPQDIVLPGMLVIFDVHIEVYLFETSTLEGYSVI